MEELIVIIAVAVSAIIVVAKLYSSLPTKKHDSSPCASCSSSGNCSAQNSDGSCGCSLGQENKNRVNNGK